MRKCKHYKAGERSAREEEVAGIQFSYMIVINLHLELT